MLLVTSRKADKNEDPVDNGKKPLNLQKQKHEWKPNDNSDGVGSSKAFETHHPKETQDDALLTDEIQQEEVEDTTVQVTKLVAQEVPVISPVALSAAHDVPLGNKEVQVTQQIVVASPQNNVNSATTFSMPLHNVFDEIVRPQVIRNDIEPILTLVSNFPNIQNIMARPNDHVDPVLQKEMEMVKASLVNSVTAEVSSTLYLTKS